MVGFIGGNVMRGQVEIVHGEDLTSKDLETMQVVDVRSPAEFSRGHMRHAVNISIDTLRENVDRLDKGRQTLVYCQVGYRGYLAYRILKQKGFEHVVNLDGGYKTLVEAGFTSLREV